MTNGQLYKALSSNKYVVVRNWIGIPLGLNSKIALKLCREDVEKMSNRKSSHIMSFYPCSIHEYISKKLSGMNSTKSTNGN